MLCLASWQNLQPNTRCLGWLPHWYCTKCYRLKGVEIDCNLKYDTHINIIIGKAYARVGVLFKGFASRNLHILRQAFNVRATSSWICVKCLVAIFTKAHKFHWKSPKAIHETYTTFVSPIISRTSCSVNRASWTS